MEGFQGEDRHNPLPHITLSTTALKSAYSNTAFLFTHTSSELRKLLIPGAGNSRVGTALLGSSGMAGLRQVCYPRKGGCGQLRSRADNRRIAEGVI